MQTQRNFVTDREIDAAMANAHKLRAEAMRDMFGAFREAIRGLFVKPAGAPVAR